MAETPYPSGSSVTTTDVDLLRQLPFKQFEYQTVSFAAENVDTFVPFVTIRPDVPDDVRWIDISPNSVYTTSTGDLPPVSGGTTPAWPWIFRSGGPNRPLPTTTGIWLRCSRAPYTTRLLFFVERS